MSNIIGQLRVCASYNSHKGEAQARCAALATDGNIIQPLSYSPETIHVTNILYRLPWYYYPL